MEEPFSLILKIYPLYLIVGLGYLAGRFLKADRHTLSSILIYIIAPVVVFYGVATAPKDSPYLLLTGVFFLTAMLLSFSFYYIAGKIWRGSEKNLISKMAGSNNTGYFGIPLAVALFGQEGLSIAVHVTLGLILYESTRGYYIVAKSDTSASQAFLKVIKLPVIYAAALGVLVHSLSISFSSSLEAAFGYFTGSYSLLGMMVLGVVLASVNRSSFDKLFTSLSFFAKFAAYPVLIGLFVYLDNSLFHIFSGEVHKAIMVLSIAPMATNTVTYATYLKVKPEKAALTVLLSTLFALVYIPLFIWAFL